MKLRLCLASMLLISSGKLVRAETVDLPSVLKLAGAQNLDVQIAREKLSEARAQEEAARWQFFPWMTVGAGYRAHDGRIQAVEGSVFDASKQSYHVGPGVQTQIDLGDTLYKHLVAKQLTRAAEHGAEAQRQQSMLAAAETYFDLCTAQAGADVAAEALKTSQEYKDQIASGVKAGIAFKGDELRAQTQLQKYRLQLQQAQEDRRVAAARLAQVLHLDGTVDLFPARTDLVALNLAPGGTKLGDLISRALANRPELRQSGALVDAAGIAAKGTRAGPLIPSVGAQAVAGGLGGGQSGDWGNFGGSEDYAITLGWRIGPGGLFDRTRIRAAESRERQAGLIEARTKDDVIRQVIENHERVKHLRSQLATARESVAAAQEALKLARERKEFAVGIVLETLQSEQDVTSARLDYVRTMMELNKVQYRLKAAVGETPGSGK